MRFMFIVVVALGFVGCESGGEGAGVDSTSRFERGMERVGKGIESAAADVGTELSETRIQMILDNIKGMDSVQAEITGDGSVTLIGNVATETARAEAERLVGSIEGVDNVHNAIEIGSGGTRTTSDAATGADSLSDTAAAR